MPFVHVKHVRLDSNRRECFHPAYAEHDLLTPAHLKYAAVKLGGNQSVLGAVFRNIGVEQVDVYTADAQFPNPCKNIPVQNGNRDKKFCFAAADFSDRQVIKILIEINRLLNAVLVDLLPEIAVSVKQTDRDEFQIKITGRFAMVAGENAQPAGVIRDRFVKTEFGRKIGNGIFDRAAGTGFPVGIVSTQIFFEFLKDLLELAHEIFVLCELFQPRLPRKLQHADWIMICAVPQFGIEMTKKTARGRLPRPPEIKTHLPQRLQYRRQDGSHIVSLKSWLANARHCSRGR